MRGPHLHCLPVAALAVLALAPLPVSANPVSFQPTASTAARPLSFRALPGVVLSPEVARQLDLVAAPYLRRTRRQLVVTSGSRTVESQAAAMYAKLRKGRRLLRLYRHRALALEVIKAYRAARRRRMGRGATLAAMAAVMRRQVASGEYVSAHLRHGAVDIRSRGMRRRHKRVFRWLVGRTRGVRLIKEERHPPHFHLEVDPPPPR